MEEGKFRLQPVLSYRERLEEALQLEMSRLDKTYQCEQDLLDRMLSEKREHMESLRAQWQEAKQDMHFLEMGLEFLRHISRNVDAQSSLVEGLKSALHKKRAELIEVSNARRTLEKLKEKQRLCWVRQKSKLEDKRSEDLAAMRHFREKSSLV